jgi:3-oxoacyl-[acyl-carrier protein] reductase
MNLNLSDRAIVVTGASKGIGAATAKMLSAEGARLLLVARTGGELVETASRCEGEAIALALDVTGEDAAAAIVSTCLDRFGRIDGLVNNAGSGKTIPPDQVTEEDWWQQLNLNVMAPMRLMRHFAPQMAKRGWGRIVNVTSSAGKRPSQTWPAYSVAKAAQHSLSRAYADFWAAHGVHVNAVAPGPTGTSLWRGPGGLAEQIAARDGITPEEAMARQTTKVPLGRFGEAGEVAAVVAFLCSERASWITGAAWSADGGTWQSML